MQSYLEDDFQLNEIEMLEAYIKPEDHRRAVWRGLRCRMSVRRGGRGVRIHEPSLRARVLSLHQPAAVHVGARGRFDRRLARKRLLSCGLGDRVTVICTEVARDRYMAQLTEYLKFYNARFDTVISMLPSGDGLIQYVQKSRVF